MEYLTDEESLQLQRLAQATETLIDRIREAAKTHRAIEQELAHAVNGSSLALSEALPSKSSATTGSPEFLSRSTAVEVSVSVKALYNETQALLEGKLQLDSPQQEDGLRHALSAVSQEMQKLSSAHWLAPIVSSSEEGMSQESSGSSSKGSLKLRLSLAKAKKEKLQKQKSSGALPVENWGPEDVAAWLEALDLGEYKELFMRHDIQGSELVLLERRDLKDLGISKVGHLKRILQGIKDASSQP
ncbi:hypothetical protein JRQ81_007254 [Phrynocephalus forsythii]|uniref:SAM domain-containing protein n=1 Tax=Phrynocephalus forsythii TaxID=171643 RepID=A0A9Q0XD36_9SAUR|nr:hypothetical protein JRQ81_007254 [Phrynocephalus forsythii]